MSGPFTLKYLHLFLREKSAGAFILSRNGRSADFVGVSADDLANAARRCAGESGYHYMWFTATASADEAYELGHAWYHRYHPNDNVSPPSNGSGPTWHCTVKGCPACALSAT